MTSRRDLLSASLALAATAALPNSATRAAAKIRFAANPFSLGVASGYPTAHSVVLWTRLAPSPLEPGGGMPQTVVPVHWELATDEAFKSIVRKDTVYATPDWAHSVHVEPEGLESGREYWYRFMAGDTRSTVGRTRTAAASGAPLNRLRLAVASCQQYEHGYFNSYRHMLDDELDVIVHVGDYIYELSWGEGRVRSHSAPEVYTLDDYRARYSLYKGDPDLLAAHAAYPWLAIWDDHEVDNDYAADLSEDNDEPALFLARREAAYRAYYEHMPLPARMIPFGPSMRLYSQQHFGDLVSISLLDQRQYRSSEACPRLGRAGSNRVTQDCSELSAENRTMLGSRQESWLAGALTSNRRQWNLLAQGTVMSYLDEDPGPGTVFWTDGWNGYPAARARLMNFLAQEKISNPVVLSGDIHAFIVSGLHQRAAELNSPVVAAELVTTSISSQALAQGTLDKWRASNPNLLLATSEHRGYTRLDITSERLQADLISVDSVKTERTARKTLRSFAIETSRPQPQEA
jgi:alkaline phosphatase D